MTIQKLAISLVLAPVSALTHAFTPSSLANASLIVRHSCLDILHNGLDGVASLVSITVN